MKKEKESNLRTKAHDSVDKAMDKAENISVSTKEKIAHLKEKARMMRMRVDGYIKENPERSVLIAAGIGVVTGAVITALIMKRRR